MSRSIIGGVLAVLVFATNLLEQNALAQAARKNVSNDDLFVESVLSEDIGGYATPAGHWKVELPVDYGAHSDYQQDYWGINGNLATSAGKRFGFQLVLYRLALMPPRRADEANTASAWRAKDIFAGYFALTDVDSQRFVVHERVSRAALGLSGSSNKPIRVWLDNWALEQAGEDGSTLGVSVKADNVSINLALRESKRAFLPASEDRDQSRAASPFRLFVLPRLIADGSITIDETNYDVSGSVWMDRAWGKVPITTGQMTLDRFLIHLGDGRDLMLTELKRRGGGGVPVRGGAIVNREGHVSNLEGEDIKIAVLRSWQSPRDGLRYPSTWHIEIPKAKLSADITPLVRDQEITVWPRYWSGAAEVTGQAADAAIKGAGYVQLLGYAAK
jgi:predicted secreted hydrolase